MAMARCVASNFLLYAAVYVLSSAAFLPSIHLRRKLARRLLAAPNTLPGS